MQCMRATLQRRTEHLWPALAVVRACMGCRGPGLAWRHARLPSCLHALPRACPCPTPLYRPAYCVYCLTYCVYCLVHRSRARATPRSSACCLWTSAPSRCERGKGPGVGCFVLGGRDTQPWGPKGCRLGAECAGLAVCGLCVRASGRRALRTCVCVCVCIEVAPCAHANPPAPACAAAASATCTRRCWAPACTRPALSPSSPTSASPPP